MLIKFADFAWKNQHCFYQFSARIILIMKLLYYRT